MSRILTVSTATATVLIALAACKTADRSRAKLRDADGEVQGETESQTTPGTSNTGALDVNDVSILFEKTGPGQFYPNIPIASVWPSSAFTDLVTFTQTGKLGEVKFGQYILPANYVPKVKEFINNPNKAANNNDVVSLTAKEIGTAIKASGSVCEDKPDGTMLCVDKPALVSYDRHRDAIAKQDSWRIVSLRMDLCAGPAPGEKGECDVEFRLIAQPFGDFPPAPPVPGKNPDGTPLLNPDGTPKFVIPPVNTQPGQRGPIMFDVSAHLLYKVGKLEVETGKITDGNGEFVANAIDLVKDIQAVKRASPELTDGRPLGVHPGLRLEARNGSGQKLGDAVKTLIQKYTKGGAAMSGTTSMHLSGLTQFDSSIWTFFQGNVANGRWSPTPITGSTNIWSIRTASTQGPTGKMFPPPALQNRTRSINPIFFPAPGQPIPKETQLLPAFFDNPGAYGDPALKVNGMDASSVKNTDCVSCHMTAIRAFENGLRHTDATYPGGVKPTMYAPPVGTTGYLDPEVIPRIDYSLRNFGFFTPPPFVNPLPANAESIGLGVFNFTGPRTESAAIMTRVAYESAELVNFINSRYLKLPNPGLMCSGENVTAAFQLTQNGNIYTPEIQKQLRRDPKKHAAIADCLLFTGFKPGSTFAACAPGCNTAASTEALPPIVITSADARCDAVTPQGSEACENLKGGCHWSEVFNEGRGKCIDTRNRECPHYENDDSFCTTSIDTCGANCIMDGGKCDWTPSSKALLAQRGPKCTPPRAN